MRFVILGFFTSIFFGIAAPVLADETLAEARHRVFTIQKELVLPGTPEEIYDAITGDISGWWDHKFSEAPAAFEIDARPGGLFVERYDDDGNGVVHGVVIYADRGKRLTFEGPLGFNGKALKLVITYRFQKSDKGTKLHFELNGAGQVEDGWDVAVSQVWDHFLFERFKPYIEAGCHKSETCSAFP